MKAIHSFSIPCSNTRSRRIKASAGGRAKDTCSLTMSYPDEAQNSFEAHRIVVTALVRKLAWEPVTLIGGQFENGDWVWVIDKFSETTNPCRVKIE